MGMRMHEVHPAVVHFPLTLAPLALLADVVGRVSRRDDLMDLGGVLMPIAAETGVIAGAAGLVAQEAVTANGRSHDLLVTHRNLNLVMVAALG